MKKYRKSKTNTKALKTRGGFLGQKPLSSLVTNARRSGLKPEHVGAFIQYVAKGHPKAEAYITNGLKTLSTAKVAAKVGGKVIDIVEQGLAGQESTETVAQTETIISGRSTPSSTVGKTFKTTFTVGDRPTKTVSALGRSNGTSKFVSFDSTTMNKEGSARDSLTLRTGFNEKTLAAYDTRSYWTMGDLEGLVDANTFQRSVGSYQRAYWMTKSFGVKYRMLNRNKYNKMRVKVHFCRQEKVDNAPKTWFSECFSTLLPTVVDTNVRTIPYNLQMANKVQSSLITSCAVDPVLGSLRKARIFDETFTIQKTFSRWLEPGEVWEIDYNHLTGPGLRLDSLIMTDDAFEWDQTAAAFFYPIFEVVGPQVECYDSQNGLNSYIGSCSGSIQLEMKKHCEIVQASFDPSNLYEANDGYNEQRWAYRVYSNSMTSPDTTAITRRFSVPYDDILIPGQVAQLDKYIIPVTTDQQVVRGGKTATAD